jgi:hypothetical protein
MLSEEERAFKAEQNRLERESKEKIAASKGTYPDMHPKKRYDLTLKQWKTDIKGQLIGPGQYVHPGWELASKNTPAFVEGELIIRDAKEKALRDKLPIKAKAVHPEYYKEDGTVNVSLLSGGLVYYDSMSKEWFIINNPGPSAIPKTVPTYIDGLVELKESEAPVSKEQLSGSELAVPDGDQKKVVKKFEDVDYSQYTAKDFMPKGSTDVIEESIKTAGKTGEDITKFWEWVAAPKGIAKKKNDQMVKKADGGRIGYAEGDIVEDPLDNLKAWWNDQAWNNEG